MKQNRTEAEQPRCPRCGAYLPVRAWALTPPPTAQTYAYLTGRCGYVTGGRACAQPYAAVWTGAGLRWAFPPTFQDLQGSPEEWVAKYGQDKGLRGKE